MVQKNIWRGLDDFSHMTRKDKEEADGDPSSFSLHRRHSGGPTIPRKGTYRGPSGSAFKIRPWQISLQIFYRPRCQQQCPKQQWPHLLQKINIYQSSIYLTKHQYVPNDIPKKMMGTGIWSRQSPYLVMVKSSMVDENGPTDLTSCYSVSTSSTVIDP